MKIAVDSYFATGLITQSTFRNLYFFFYLPITMPLFPKFYSFYFKTSIVFHTPIIAHMGAELQVHFFYYIFNVPIKLWGQDTNGEGLAEP